MQNMKREKTKKIDEENKFLRNRLRMEVVRTGKRRRDVLTTPRKLGHIKKKQW